jgi:hypothetical protein
VGLRWAHQEAVDGPDYGERLHGARPLDTAVERGPGSGEHFHNGVPGSEEVTVKFPCVARVCYFVVPAHCSPDDVDSFIVIGICQRDGA